MSWIHLDDLVRLLVWAAERREGLGVINGVAPAPVRNTEFTAALARTLGRPAVIPVPALALRTALGDLSTVLLASQRVVPAAATQAGFRFDFPTIDAALADCCAEPGHEDVWEQWLPAPPEAVFPFFSNPYNLEAITPDFLQFRVLADLDVLGAGRHADRLSAVTPRRSATLAERDRGLGASAALRRPTDAGTLRALASHARVRAEGRRHADS